MQVDFYGGSWTLRRISHRCLSAATRSGYRLQKSGFTSSGIARNVEDATDHVVRRADVPSNAWGSARGQHSLFVQRSSAGNGVLPVYPLFRSPAVSPLIVRWIPVTTSSSVSPAR